MFREYQISEKVIFLIKVFIKLFVRSFVNTHPVLQNFFTVVIYGQDQGILKGEVSLYH